MQILINLLPPKEKEHMRRFLRMRIFLKYGTLLVMVPIVVMIVLAGLLVASHIEQSGLSHTANIIQSQGDFQEMERNDDRVHRINRAVAQAQKMSRQQRFPSEIFLIISDIIPAQIRVSHIEITDDVVVVRGTAKARNTVIDFKKEMEASGCFSDVALPLTSLVDRQDTDFTITAKKITCP